MRMSIVRYRTTVDSATVGYDSTVSLRRAADMRLVATFRRSIRMAKPVLWRRTSSVHGFSATFRSVCMWSHYDNIGPRTTNVAEGFHNGFNSRFEKSHPSLRLFLALLLMPPFTTSTFLAAHSNDFRCRAA